MKAFLEVFAGIQVDQDLLGLAELIRVDRVTVNRSRTKLRVYTESPRLLFRGTVDRLERTISRQLFPGRNVDVHIQEKYHLSEQYTPESLMEVYRDSISQELRRYSILLFTMFRRARISYAGKDGMTLDLEDSRIAREKAPELKRVLEKIFNERCQVPLEITLAWHEPATKQEEASEAYVLQVPEKGVQAIAEPERGFPASSGEDGMAGDASGAREASGAGGASPENAGKTGTPAGKAVPGENARKKAAAGDAHGQEKSTFRGQRDGQKDRFADRGRGKKFGRGARRPYSRSENEDVLYGRDFTDEPIPISELEERSGITAVRGQILKEEERELRTGNKLFIFNISDFTDTISVKIFSSEESLDDLKNATRPGTFVVIRGVLTHDKFDGELTLGSVSGIKKCADFRTKREDHSEIKRVELHCHTKMSDMDGVSDVADIVSRAKSWGMDAIAVTDHGSVQAFPDAAGAAGKDIKILYGMEGYLVDDTLELVVNGKGQSLDDPCVVFDIETTGFSAVRDRVIEIGAVKVEHGRITDKFSTFVNPKVPIPFRIEELTSINDSMVVNAPPIEEVLPEFFRFCGDAVIVAHNASFDTGFMRENARRLGLPYDPTILDTVSLARMLLPNLHRFKLDTVAKELHISLENHHRAVDDAGCTAEIFCRFVEMLKNRGIRTLGELAEKDRMTPDMIRKMPTYHIILLAKNDLGRINLYRLVSESCINYFARKPRIPRSILKKYREGLILGSACEAGELFQAIERDVPESRLGKIVEFYDYLEIQPTGNNEFLLRNESSGYHDEEDLRNLNRKIVRLGEKFNKPVCATCDVHFLDPEDEIYRRIIMYSKGFEDADHQPPLYLRTTEEMLEEFSYLGSDKAREVVITNTRKIAAMIEPIQPTRPDKRPPIIPDSDKTLRTICYNRAHEIYGENLPKIVTDRLEVELNSIISNGYAVMYIIAQKLVWKANEDGYLVGSRGSVGSSFVATMAGITEVNPLSPHYYCPNCHYYDFDSEDVKKYAGMAGCDMPDKVCPKCGKPLKKDGFDIPFETFLGFTGNKEPDIDLNFSGEYQSRAHAYTEVIFGKGQTFRAGTVGTVADKTAFGYVLRYCEDKGIFKRPCEMDRIASGMVGVRRTTGQHPGGIIVLPVGEDINSFTPVQHPADDPESRTITTHFDYHKIDKNLLKLDILGHDDPTMIRMLQDLTGKDPTTFPLDDRRVMSLFQNTDALGIKPEDIGGCPLGCLGIPEFGTDFAMQMLLDTKPKYLSDLVRIAGLAHGTDVWLGNAETLIKEGTCTISTAICCRDDIMIYLMGKGLDPALAFNIMEKVRKGKGLKQEWIDEMKKHDVPDWYIWSCKKIKYMFPKAHAAAYVMMAWRIAYCKIYYPLAYYAAFFSIRANAFDYEKMCQGRERLEENLARLRARKDAGEKLTSKDEDSIRDMRVVQEMYARGFSFMPIDIYRADSRHFQIIDGKLMPSLGSIDGLGEKAADAIMFAAEEGKFLSKEDFMNRTKVGRSICDQLDRLGLLSGLPESNQLSLFDLL
ncbi:PolC-type DNA polymerase III [Clostridium vitabionis]|uniref:PolC-type DNA polymerase III n=1 Tax=Clostridium vitabionis TaxID=2784388 RepID=UPI00188C173F|nr:PolC-type DNA polymerase III [Clostridium vitabionis]